MDDQPIPLSALQHYSYCPRQYALIHIEQAFEENVHTLRGQAVHERVDMPVGEDRRDGMRVERALPLFHDELGLIGKADVVEFLADGTPYPVEYKHGPRRQRQHDDLQLAAQAMCLEAMLGKAVAEGAIYHAASRRRRVVKIDAALRAKVVELIAAIRQIQASGQLPAPANDARCEQCSLIDLCQPSVLGDRLRLHTLRGQLFEPGDE